LLHSRNEEGDHGFCLEATSEVRRFIQESRRTRNHGGKTIFGFASPTEAKTCLSPGTKFHKGMTLAKISRSLYLDITIVCNNICLGNDVMEFSEANHGNACERN
jgi:hypothetical protein